MKKIVNSDKAPKDELLNKIMQEIDDENTSAQQTNASKNKTKPKVNPWKRWFVNFIFLLISLVFIFVLILIYKATEEVSEDKSVSVKNVEKNSSVKIKDTIKKTELAEKPQKNVLIFNMKAKAPHSDIKKEEHTVPQKTEKRETSFSEREKAKALLKEQMSH